MTTLTDDGRGYDVAIGGLPFLIDARSDRPYERATAQFRKEQFDSTPTVGDQSLTGWWTRGQLSFHKGGGTKYYETLDGETVLDTFWRNSYTVVNTPGAVTLAYKTDTLTLTTPVDMVTSVNYILGETWRVSLDNSGGLSRIQDSTDLTTQVALALATSDGGACTSIAASPTQVWLTNGNFIEYWTPGVGAVSTVVYTLTDVGVTWEKVFYLKGRLWAVDSAENWYMLAADVTPASVSKAVDSFSTTPAQGSTLASYSAVASPDSIFVARDNYVFRITLDTSSLVPVPSQLVEAAALPTQETINGIGFALGMLALCTIHGMRFAAVSTDGIVYGPLVAEGIDFSKARRVAAKKSMIYVPGVDIEEPLKAFVYAFDMSQNDDLTPPWSREYEMSLPNGSWRLGAYPGRYGLEFWSSTAGTLYRNDDETFIYSDRSLQPEGYVRTGLHRLGTLEPKMFSKVSVRAAGDGGTVTTYLIEQDGTETNLGTLTLPGETGLDADLNMAAPTEAVALKFVLTRDATDDTIGPELLGYQLRALPAPQRQRMIRVPLLLNDREKRGSTRPRGYEGSAWDRLAALEAMEESGAVHDYQDFRTGESCQVFLESVEHRGVTSPNGDSTGFGGTVFLTMRKI